LNINSLADVYHARHATLTSSERPTVPTNLQAMFTSEVTAVHISAVRTLG
jgi:hypothetical protein